ncbi:MAG: RNA methyltransferase [Bacilli bacterium]|nr:RNA methyltransferase [Bacilli bacterium]MDD4808846.1 RNA methyltransferase [Bacilli bacterium]
MIYTSIDNLKIKKLKKLQTKKYRDLEEVFLVEGEHLILEAYKTGYLKELILEENEASDLDIDVMYVNSKVMRHLSELESPSKMIGVCHKKSNKGYGNRILMIDDIQDPGNLGSIIRSAVAFNVDTIILSDKTVDLYNSKVIRASQGMMFYVNIISRNLLTEIPELKNQGYEIVGTQMTNGIALKEFNFNEKSVIIMGNEGNGVKNEILTLCDKYLYIEMNEACESLNVGVAASIILYEMDK